MFPLCVRYHLSSAQPRQQDTAPAFKEFTVWHTPGVRRTELYHMRQGPVPAVSKAPPEDLMGSTYMEKNFKSFGGLSRPLIDQ